MDFKGTPFVLLFVLKERKSFFKTWGSFPYNVTVLYVCLFAEFNVMKMGFLTKIVFIKLLE